eukprot:6793372-Prymnesium_polylepis.1
MDKARRFMHYGSIKLHIPTWSRECHGGTAVARRNMNHSEPLSPRSASASPSSAAATAGVSWPLAT